MTRLTSLGQAVHIALQQAVLRIGNEKAPEATLNSVLRLNARELPRQNRNKTCSRTGLCPMREKRNGITVTRALKRQRGPAPKIRSTIGEWSCWGWKTVIKAVGTPEPISFFYRENVLRKP